MCQAVDLTQARRSKRETLTWESANSFITRNGGSYTEFKDLGLFSCNAMCAGAPCSALITDRAPVWHALFAKLDCKTNNAMTHHCLGIYSSSTSSTRAPMLRCWVLLGAVSTPVAEEVVGLDFSAPSLLLPLDDAGRAGLAAWTAFCGVSSLVSTWVPFALASRLAFFL